MRTLFGAAFVAAIVCAAVVLAFSAGPADATSMLVTMAVAIVPTVDEELKRKFDEHHNEVKAVLEKAGLNIANLQQKHDELQGTITEIGQELARRKPGGGGGGEVIESAGALVAKSAELKAFGGSAARGKFAVRLASKSITSATGSGGAFIQADKRPDPVLMAQQRLTIRNLVAPGTTGSNAVEYPRQITRTNNAAAVAEGAVKPESDYAFELVTANVRTIAHWVTASKQALDDSSVLQATIDGELRYGLKLKEEDQLLNGDGTGVNLYGIIPQASDFSPTLAFPANPQAFDLLLMAIAQVEAALLPATGIVMNDQKLRSLQMIKDGEGRYIGGGPFGPPITSIWGVPTVGTPSMETQEFVVGAFRDAAQIFDREEAVVEISTEHSDYFTRNLIAVRAEERLAFAVKRPTGFVHGEFGDAS